jgi:oligopeptide/dipeptide ABC transporter ATP-binding protein
VSEALLQVNGLRVTARDEGQRVDIVRDISFSVSRGEILGIVGESGSGKTMASLALLRLLPANVSITAGTIAFDGADVRTLGPGALRRLRGGSIAMVFQDPMASLNPLFTVGYQIAAVLRAHDAAPKKEVRTRVVDLLRRVRLPDPEGIYARYPHELSGGMRQRVMIAMAISCQPRLVIADEPTTALDVTVQSQILELLKDLRAETGMGIIYISHDLAVIAQLADRVAVMYAGAIVEETQARTLFRRPLHPYTQALLAVSPTLATPRDAHMPTIAGSVPRPGAIPSGCPFHPRCPHAFDRCRVEVPPTIDVVGSSVVCHLYPEAAPQVAPQGTTSVAH